MRHCAKVASQPVYVTIERLRKRKRYAGEPKLPALLNRTSGELECRRKPASFSTKIFAGRRLSERPS